MLISVMHIGWTLPEVAPASVFSPTWQQIEGVVRQMNGHGRCQVITVVDDENYLLLGGGAGGHYVCQIDCLRGNFVLCDPMQQGEDLVLINDGQPSLYVARHVVDLGKVLQAARFFATNLDLDPSLTWDRY